VAYGVIRGGAVKDDALTVATVMRYRRMPPGASAKTLFTRRPVSGHLGNLEVPTLNTCRIHRQFIVPSSSKSVGRKQGGKTLLIEEGAER
jgi:hypothetical protein